MSKWESDLHPKQKYTLKHLSRSSQFGQINSCQQHRYFARAKITGATAGNIKPNGPCLRCSLRAGGRAQQITKEGALWFRRPSVEAEMFSTAAHRCFGTSQGRDDDLGEVTAAHKRCLQTQGDGSPVPPGCLWGYTDPLLTFESLMLCFLVENWSKNAIPILFRNACDK